MSPVQKPLRLESGPFRRPRAGPS